MVGLLVVVCDAPPVRGQSPPNPPPNPYSACFHLHGSGRFPPLGDTVDFVLAPLVGPRPERQVWRLSPTNRADFTILWWAEAPGLKGWYLEDGKLWQVQAWFGSQGMRGRAIARAGQYADTSRFEGYPVNCRDRAIDPL